MSADGRTRLPDAAPLLEVTTADDAQRNSSELFPDTFSHGRTALIPFVKSWLDSVDLEKKRLVMHLPPGLVTLESAEDEPIRNPKPVL
jgi:hypothetical protein